MKRISLILAALLLMACGCAAEESQGPITDIAQAEPAQVDVPMPTVEALLTSGVEIALTEEQEDGEGDGANLLAGIGLPGMGGAYGNVKAALLLGGSREDPLDSLGYEALMDMQSSLGVQGELREGVSPEEAPAILEELINGGCSFIMVHDSALFPAVEAAAESHPEVAFCVAAGSGEVSLGRENIGCVSVLDQGVLLGAVMGALSQKDSICLVTRGETGEVNNGMRLANPACRLQVIPAEAEDWEEQLRRAIEDGADVIAGDEPAMQAAIAAIAAQEGVYALGFGLDAYALAPEAVVLSILPDYSLMYSDALQRCMDGEYTDGVYSYGLGDGGLRLSGWNGWDEKLPEDTVDAVDQMVESLFSGEAYDY